MTCLILLEKIVSTLYAICVKFNIDNNKAHYALKAHCNTVISISTFFLCDAMLIARIR